MPSQPSDPELRILANALAGLEPSAGGLSRDRLLFQTGGAAAARVGRTWRTLALLLAGFSLYLGYRVAMGPEPAEPNVVEKLVYMLQPASPGPEPTPSAVVEPGPPAPARSAEPDSILANLWPPRETHRRMQDQLARWGLDALPAGPAIGAPPPMGEWPDVSPTPRRRPEPESGWPSLLY